MGPDHSQKRVLSWQDVGDTAQKQPCTVIDSHGNNPNPKVIQKQRLKPLCRWVPSQASASRAASIRFSSSWSCGAGFFRMEGLCKRKRLFSRAS
mmetsp:Transcript_61425/g.85445  ORF Transcript_61425/g.85445 Transcript_61425/m.85445 type:complete len:94 (-) Transcript_61425:104-385(-)